VNNVIDNLRIAPQPVLDAILQRALTPETLDRIAADVEAAPAKPTIEDRERIGVQVTTATGGRFAAYVNTFNCKYHVGKFRDEGSAWLAAERFAANMRSERRRRCDERDAEEAERFGFEHQ